MNNILYPKINSVYKRDPKGKILDGEFALPEFEYLQFNAWHFTEKIHGFSTRFSYQSNDFRGNEHAFVFGRTENSQIPPKYMTAHVDLMKKLPFEDVFDAHGSDVTLYGESIGPGAQKHGEKYFSEPTFILFDVRVGEHWLSYENVQDVGQKLGIPIVPFVAILSLHDAIEVVKNKRLVSHWPEVEPEGIVGRPVVPLYDRKGDRTVVKVKGVDFQ